MSFPFVCPVVGVSSYQDVVASAGVGDPVRVVHEPLNAFDPNALRVVSGSGLLGYLPAALASRLVAVADSFEAEIAEVLVGDFCVGLRVRVRGPAAPMEDTSADAALAEGTPADAVTVDPGTGLLPDSAPAPVVFARSGRPLGSLVERKGDVVVVLADDRCVEYPAFLVDVSAV